MSILLKSAAYCKRPSDEAEIIVRLSTQAQPIYISVLQDINNLIILNVSPTDAIKSIYYELANNPIRTQKQKEILIELERKNDGRITWEMFDKIFKFQN